MTRRKADSAGGRSSSDPSLRDRLARLRPKELRDLARKHGVNVRNLRNKDELAHALSTSSAAGEIGRELAGAATLDEDWLREELAATRDAIREAANIGAAVRVAEDFWRAAADALEQGRGSEARDHLEVVARRTTEAHDRRVREIETALSVVSENIARAREVGAEAPEAAILLEEARMALTAREYPRADEAVKRAERAAMQVQQKQIERAIQLRESQMERAQAIISACEPLLQEAESYDLKVSEVRTLLRQARDVLAKGDYIAGLTFARNAEEAAYRLEALVEEERRRRGIVTPTPGMCGACGSRDLSFYEDGWGRCGNCGAEFRWRPPLGVRERVRVLLGT